MAAGDFNGDSRTDLASRVPFWELDELGIKLGLGTARLSPAMVCSARGREPAGWSRRTSIATDKHDVGVWPPGRRRRLLPAQPRLPGPQPQISVGDATIVEGRGPLAFKVSLSQPSSQTVTVSYATSSGSATAGQRLHDHSGTLSFATPGTTSLTALVPRVYGQHLRDDRRPLVRPQHACERDVLPIVRARSHCRQHAVRRASPCAAASRRKGGRHFRRHALGGERADGIRRVRHGGRDCHGR